MHCASRAKQGHFFVAFEKPQGMLLSVLAAARPIVQSLEDPSPPIRRLRTVSSWEIPGGLSVVVHSPGRLVGGRTKGGQLLVGKWVFVGWRRGVLLESIRERPMSSEVGRQSSI